MKKIIFLALALCWLVGGCSSKKEPGPALPDNPVERAAVQGLIASYRESAMWEVKSIKPLRIQPVAPTRSFLENYDPKELYCVCLEYQARYKVPWTTSEGSPWERTVRSILVMKTQGDNLMAVRPAALCPPLCE